jgi:hypothetical protein
MSTAVDTIGEYYVSSASLKHGCREGAEVLKGRIVRMGGGVTRGRHKSCVRGGRQPLSWQLTT